MELKERVALVALTAEGGALARRIADALGGAEVHGLRGRVGEANVWFLETIRHVRGLFEAGRPIVGVCAAGILVRSVAPALADKREEPPVVAVSEDGAFAVPLLGGHRGGVELARRIAAATGGTAAVTTAGDRRFDIALDAPPAGWTLSNPDDCKPFVAALLQGARVRAPDGLRRLAGSEFPIDEAGQRSTRVGGGSESGAPSTDGVRWLAGSRLPFDDAGELTIRVDDARAGGSLDTLVYRPRWLAIGIGCERGAAAAGIESLVRSCLEAAGLAPEAIGGVFSIDLKADEPAVHALAESLGVPTRFFSAADLEAEAPRLRNPSDLVFREVGCHGVAEGAALAAAGPAGELIVEKTKSVRGTCAIARAPAPFDATSIGSPRGELAVVGIGPGDAGTLTPEARAAIEGAEHLVGYRRYLDLVAGLVRGGQILHPYRLGEERTRVERSMDLAARGARVALVCSGDPGIYALASLVMEMLDGAVDPAVRRIAVRVVPGVSALQAAAARAGAAVGHDFCAVSLSDLLTPREVIEERLAAAARADFVIALYNPVSAARRETFDRALRILREHRAADTPVVVARNLGRPGERVDIVPLSGIDPERIDMLTVLILGSSATRTFAHGDATRAYTPRGYEALGDGASSPRVARHGKPVS